MLTDRVVRVWLTAVSAVVWTIALAASGLSDSFGKLLLTPLALGTGGLPLLGARDAKRALPLGDELDHGLLHPLARLRIGIGEVEHDLGAPSIAVNVLGAAARMAEASAPAQCQNAGGTEARLAEPGCAGGHQVTAPFSSRCQAYEPRVEELVRGQGCLPPYRVSWHSQLSRAVMSRSAPANWNGALQGLLPGHGLAGAARRFSVCCALAVALAGLVSCRRIRWSCSRCWAWGC